MTIQPTLFAVGAPALDRTFSRIRRVDFGNGAWVDYHPAWCSGADQLFREIQDGTEWHAHRRPMYERVVDVPRLTGSIEIEEAPGVIAEAVVLLSERYGFVLDRVTAARYRSGNDSVAWHADRVGAMADDIVVAILSLGGPRKFMVRRGTRGPSTAYTLGSGDLLVMGGSSQRHLQHGVPKVAHAEPRISVMFRPELPGEEDYEEV
jgi:alkylated DNA repair dioxygenase AlkB